MQVSAAGVLDSRRMRKTAFIFVVTVLAPSLLLAWLAFRSLRDQELVMERQRLLLYEAAAQNVIKDINEFFVREQAAFAQAVERALVKNDPLRISQTFDPLVRKIYPLADVGFVVSLKGEMLSPSLLERPEARRFRLENELFLTSKETAQVYWNGPKGPVNLSQLDEQKGLIEGKGLSGGGPMSTRTEFRDLIGAERQGIVARYVQDKLALILWHRSALDDDLVFGARLHLPRMIEQISKLIAVDAKLENQIVLELLNEENVPVAVSDQAGVNLAAGRRFVSVEIGENLPHWKVGVQLRNPAKFKEAASSLRSLIGLLIATLLTAIAVGGWLIVSDMNRELKLASQRTNFVSNVSHELKTPLTSIRMFSEMLAEGRVHDPVKQRQFSSIISTETARLTRLINNVLDFARMDRGEKQYRFEELDLTDLVRRTVERYRPHLEADGFELGLEIEREKVWVRADADAITQVLLNLLSNAEKYSGAQKEITVNVTVSSTRGADSERSKDHDTGEGGRALVRVLDRGRGVPRGLEEKIFEQFFRAHDSLAEGIQGAGLGLSLARQIARAHGGDVTHARREGGGTCFVLELPLLNVQPNAVEERTIADRQVS